ncbi:hypothetical protein HPP92_013430 [Vanilla planifolia]|uniref:non-specific serine/threonine protein kinase n=1 Tax=Vanilla planifolia TaxID=51239 RepID=A0A835QX06_VANPL|nr:hypothetical protein HPP92_013872 [Vanilla planifolia]KAG0478711.1 hypothetical protein HPP92_013430 [Vanilla planifolia]
MPISSLQSPTGYGVGCPGSDPNLLLGKYQLDRLLGCGSSAKVYSARNLQSGQSVAIKSFSKPIVPESSLSDHIKREVFILRRLRHPHIIRLHEVLASRSRIYFVLDLAKGGDLFTRVSEAGRLSENLSRLYFQQLIAAIGYCHSRGVFHRDLKLENLLLDENGDLKVSDFGLSALPDQIKSDGLFHTVCGTPVYVAPEILAKKGYDAAAVDLWSCGVILFVLVAGYLPFNDYNLATLYRKIYRGEYRCPTWTSSELRSLIGRLLDTNPKTRITIDEILRDPWFKKGLDKEKLAAIAKFHEEPVVGEMYYKISKAEAVDAEERELNAFDIIGFSSGIDISGLFGAAPEWERFVSDEDPEVVLRRVEEAGCREGLVVSRKGKKGRAGVVVQDQHGNLIVGLWFYRLSREFTVVELQRGRAAEGREFWDVDFWIKKPLGGPRAAGHG